MRRIILFIAISIPLILFAQKKDYKTYDKALKYIRKGNPQKAKKLCLKLIKTDSTWNKPHLLLSSIYKNEGNIEEAANYLLNVYNPNNRNHIKGIEEIAGMYFRHGVYVDALYYFNKCIDLQSKQSSTEFLRFRESCLFAIQAKENPVPFNPENMGSNINSNMAEYLPVITADDNIIVFTRRVEEKDQIPQEDFFISYRDRNNIFKASYPFDISPINTALNEGALNFSPDQSMVVYTACDRDEGIGRCDIYYSSSRNWNLSRNLGSNINSKHWESQACFSPDGKYLYFVSNRPGGVGGKDIWVSRIDDGFHKAYNLGPTINTVKDEISPFIHPDNLTFYFSSNGHIGMGDYDIFVSRRADIEQDWGKPQNLGYPINTYLKENSLVVSSDGKTAYYTSNHSGFGKEDIFYFELPENKRAEALSELEVNIISSEKGKEVIFNNVHFENNSFTLDTVSFSELDELSNFLRKNKLMKINIEGHTDNVGGDIENLRLSNNRARSVYNYLINNGISDERLNYKGFGEKRPITTNETEQGRAKNRRTSFVILP
ncbi:MAG: OmpA family protein [Bacteroidota bacterium]|nr:OmpA family protein [Bacteroidota bacterium]